MKIVIKVGTQSILTPDGTPNEPIMQDLVEQIVRLQNQGHHVILVSSGAVASGRKVVRQHLGRQYGTSIGEKQVLASLGQYQLMYLYNTMFQKHKMLASQLLLTKQDYQTRQHYLNISRLLNEILQQKNIIPIINENDSVAIEELMFTDNDELSGLIAAQINADRLIILSNVAGVFTGNPADPQSKLISVIDPNHNWPEVSVNKSEHGRGGMITKLSTVRKMAQLGIKTHIASINHPSVVLSIINGDTIGTSILPLKKKSNIKRYIAYNAEKNAGFIIINACLVDILKENKRVLSILPIGIVDCSEAFKRGDLIEILSENKEKIGLGIAKYDAQKLKEYIGQTGKPEFIHYDHLHIFQP